MKQIIVLISTIVLGLSLSGVVLGMGGNVDSIATAATDEISDVIHYTTSSGIDYDAATAN